MSLLDNAYDFLNESMRRASRADREPLAWKFAVLNVVQGIELLLKARLQAEHQALVWENVDRPGKTVSLDQAVRRITGAVGIHLSSREQRSIRKAQKWRDEIVHYQFEMSPYQVESVYVQLFEFLMRFHDEHTDFGVLHDKIDQDLWHLEAELMEFFRREFVTYNGVEVSRFYPAEIMQAQKERSIHLHGRDYDRLSYGVEPGWEMSAHVPCHDCAVVKGQLHTDGCDVEACPRCFAQLLSCGCVWGEGPPEDDIEPLEVQVERMRKVLSDADSVAGSA